MQKDNYELTRNSDYTFLTADAQKKIMKDKDFNVEASIIIE